MHTAHSVHTAAQGNIALPIAHRIRRVHRTTPNLKNDLETSSCKRDDVFLYDLKETDTHYIVSVAMEKVPKDTLRVELVGHQIVVNGERFDRSNGTSPDFTLNFLLPKTTEAKQIDAIFDNGRLNISFPKNPGIPRHEIPISFAEWRVPQNIGDEDFCL